MKILSAEKIREADAYTIENEPIKSIDLMERAAQAFVNWFVKEYDSNTGVLCVAGPGICHLYRPEVRRETGADPCRGAGSISRFL